VLLVFFSWLRKRGLRDVRAVTEGDVVSLLAWLKTTTNRRGQPFSDDQRKRWLSVLKSFFRFLEAKHLVLANPAAGVSLPRVTRLPPPVLSEAQARRLIEAPAQNKVGVRGRAILELLYGTGLRLGECVRLDLADVSLLEGRLLVRSGKGRKDRVVPLVGRAAAALDLYLRDVRPQLAKSPREEGLFLSRDGDRLSRSALQMRLREYGQASGLRTRLRPHVLRHTCATHLLQGGADIRYVQRLLGHQDLRTTAIYTRVTVDDLREVIARSHPRERGWRRAAR
jgi:site-specific recombinase XerD